MKSSEFRELQNKAWRKAVRKNQQANPPYLEVLNMKYVLSVLVILLFGTVVFGQKKIKSQTTKTKTAATNIQKEETSTSKWIL